MAKKLTSQIAIQLYTLRDFVQTPKDVVKTMKRLRKIGYTRAQISGVGPIDAAELRKMMLDEGVAQAAQDIDLAMITGAGFQFWNGGIIPLLDREGISQKVVGHRFLPPGVASVPS